MKKVMAEMYQTLDGMLFDSPSVARQYEIDLFNAGIRVVEAQVTRKVAKLYALYLMSKESGAPFPGKECWHFGRCEVELLLDLVYGHRGDGAPVDVKDLLGEIRG
jgi:hypothetical protein